jgi:hypothetical protein
VKAAGEDLGETKEIMLDTGTGCIAYAVLSYGGFLGMGEKLFAIPCTWTLQITGSYWMFLRNAWRTRPDSTRTAVGYGRPDVGEQHS